MNQTAWRYVVRNVLHPTGLERPLTELSAVGMVQVVIRRVFPCFVEERLYLSRLIRGHLDRGFVFYLTIRVNRFHRAGSRLVFNCCGH